MVSAVGVGKLPGILYVLQFLEVSRGESIDKAIAVVKSGGYKGLDKYCIGSCGEE